MSTRLTLLSLIAEAAMVAGRQRLARKLTMLALALACAVFALAAALVAGGLWLATQVSPVQAALILSGGLAVLAVLFALLARGRRDDAGIDRVVQEVNRVVGAVEADMRERPLGLPLAGAGLAGLLLGLRLFGRR
ncbi:hypothetical protein LHP98_15420 [Rhodobacter sp. Har01]|uniref:hypothetical protein n=1 Tax=Rhodobacter sp. Har01 TaxID=2883999 RepID=UPI001D06E676|nr:hypothetical protein [Rhodobacter sp. Har01]MCB6179512.1 hypothetical protein [Rhodobacter sp. Har01]